MGLWKKFIKYLPTFFYWVVAVGVPSAAFLAMLYINSIWVVPFVFFGLGLLGYMIWISL